MVLKHIGILDDPLRIQHHLHIDRLTRISRQIDHRLTLKGVAQYVLPSLEGTYGKLARRLGDTGQRREGNQHALAF